MFNIHKSGMSVQRSTQVEQQWDVYSLAVRTLPADALVGRIVLLLTVCLVIRVL